MADLEEIMSGQGETAPGQDVSAQTTQDAPQAAPQGQEQAAGPETTQDEADPVTGLRKALDEERGKRRKYRDELADVRQQMARLEGFLQSQRQAPPSAPQPAPAAPDFFENPNGFVDHRLQEQLNQSVTPMREALMFNARLTAEAIHKPETVQEAENAFLQAYRSGQLDQAEAQRVLSSPNRFHEAVLWHRRSAALSEIGTDPAAYREKLKAELLAELGGQSPQPQPTGTTAAAMPTSFAGARNSGPRSTTAAWTGPRPLSELMPR